MFDIYPCNLNQQALKMIVLEMWNYNGIIYTKSTDIQGLAIVITDSM